MKTNTESIKNGTFSLYPFLSNEFINLRFPLTPLSITSTLINTPFNGHSHLSHTYLSPTQTVVEKNKNSRMTPLTSTFVYREVKKTFACIN